MTTCPTCGTLKVERNGYCATCNFTARKEEREASKPVKEKKPIKKVTAKRAIQNKEYLRLNREYLEQYPVCEVVECHYKSNQVHHMCGREGELLTNVDFFLAVCQDCHDKIHDNPEWSRSQGYLLTRSV